MGTQILDLLEETGNERRIHDEQKSPRAIATQLPAAECPRALRVVECVVDRPPAAGVQFNYYICERSQSWASFWVVNLHFVREHRPKSGGYSDLVLKSGAVVPVGRDYRAYLMKHLSRLTPDEP